MGGTSATGGAAGGICGMLSGAVSLGELGGAPAASFFLNRFFIVSRKLI